MSPVREQLVLEPDDPRRLASLCGPHNAHLKQIEQALGVAIHHRGNRFHCDGDPDPVATAEAVLHHLYRDTETRELDAETVYRTVQHLQSESRAPATRHGDSHGPIRTRQGLIHPRGGNQQRYVAAIRTHDINFGIGPAGTGKTWLAVACAVEALDQDRVERLLLVRPAVEAGEKLGFLPGDMTQKVDPYLRPLYDALYEMLGFERVNRLLERQVIEIAPLAYMRGRTLNNSFIILDESQNTTGAQMKMFLTRIGFGSTAVITGDITQVDLPQRYQSGLIHAMRVLESVEGIHFTRFQPGDVVRHPLVQRIVEAYERADRPLPDSDTP